MLNPQELARFESKFEKTDGCWKWTAATDRDGYSVLHLRGRQWRGHIVAYRQYVGPVPEGWLVCHHCDTPACLRPDHLFVGTPGMNMTDKKEKGRSTNGGGRPRLTEDDVRAIRSDTRLRRDIAADYGITIANVSLIRRRVTWVNV